MLKVFEKLSNWKLKIYLEYELKAIDEKSALRRTTKAIVQDLKLFKSIDRIAEIGIEKLN
jgi:hypothetical protein